MFAPSVSLGAWTAWVSGCAQMQIDCADQMPKDAVSSDRAVIPLRAFVEATEALAISTRNAALGWAIGEQYDLRQLGEVGKAVLCAPTLRSALKRLVDYFALVQDATELDLQIDDDHCQISYRILDPEIWPRQQDGLFTLAVVSQVLRRTSGLCWEEVEYIIEGDDPSASTYVARQTGASCQGDGEANLLRFPARFLDLPILENRTIAAPDYRALNNEVAERRRGTDLELRVRTMIYRYLGTRPINQEWIATQIGMSSRTLRRKLAGSDRSFQQIVDACRLRQAAHELRLRGNVSIAQTALRLGYSEHSTFTRAFSRWSGMPPQMFIRNGRSADRPSARAT